MRIEVTGSSPEFGSSQKRYFGLRAIALAMATLLRIPPEISEGNNRCDPLMFTLSRQKSTCLSFSPVVMLVNISIGNLTFSATFSESNRAPPWNTIPISCLSNFRVLKFIFLISLPSKRISPSSISMSLTMDFKRTVFPEPLCPIIRLVFPFSKTVEISLSTSLFSNDFCMFLISII